MALDVCGQYEKKLVVTGRPNGASSAAFTDYLMATIEDPQLESKWKGFVEKG